MVKPTASGRHDFFYEDDILGMRLRGSISRRDLETLRKGLEELASERPSFYLLTDMAECTGIDPEARKYMAEWAKAPDVGLVGTVVYGNGFMMRALITLTLKAIKLLGQREALIHFVKDEAEARRWIADDRARARAAQHGQ